MSLGRVVASLGLIALLVFSTPQPAHAASQLLTTFTTPLSMTWQQTYPNKPHPDTLPAAFTFYPNGTVKLPQYGSSSVLFYWTFAIIPLQTPTSFQANSTYVVYSARGPAQCVVQVSYKQVGNHAKESLNGTQCANSTFSMQLKNYGSNIIALNSTGGTTGTVCDLHIGELEFVWCSDALVAATASYSAGTIQIRNTAATWAMDPVALDGSNKCAMSSGVSTCNISLTTTVTNDLIIVGCGVNIAGAGSRHCTAPTATGLTFAFRTSHARSTTNNMTEWVAVAASTFSGNIACNESANGIGDCNGFGVSGADTTTKFDSNAAIPASNDGVNSKPTVSTVSTSNANDMLIGLTEDAGTTAQTGGTCAAGTCTLIQSGSAAPVVASEYLVVTSTQSSATVAFGTSTGAGNTWAMIADAVIAGTILTSFAATLSFTPLLSHATSHTSSATLTFTPVLTKQMVLARSFSRTLTLSPAFVGMRSIARSVTLSFGPVFSENVALAKTYTASIAFSPVFKQGVEEGFVKVLSLAPTFNQAVGVGQSIVLSFSSIFSPSTGNHFTFSGLVNIALNPVFHCCAGGGGTTTVTTTTTIKLNSPSFLMIGLMFGSVTGLVWFGLWRRKP